MRRPYALTPEKLVKLVELLAAGEYLDAAVKKIGIGRMTLHEAEVRDAEIKRQVRQAVAGGARYQIERAAKMVLKAKTRDESIIARHAMEAAEKRAKLVAPQDYVPQAALLPSLPTGSSAELTIKWAGDIAIPSAPLPSPAAPTPRAITTSQPLDAEHSPVDQNSTGPDALNNEIVSTQTQRSCTNESVHALDVDSRAREADPGQDAAVPGATSREAIIRSG